MHVMFVRMTRWAAQAGLAASMVIGVNAAAHAQDATTQVAETANAPTSGYHGVSRAWLWGPSLNEMVDTAKFKKDPPYVIGFSNASISNAWRVAFQHSIEYAVAQNKDKIKKFIITDANDDPAKQISDIQDLLNQGVDLLLVAASTEDALDSVVGRATKEGVPVVMVDRRVKTDSNYLSYVMASDASIGRIEAQWLAEKLNGKGNIVMLPGVAGSSVAETRIRASKEALANFPGIKVLDMQYTNWNPATGKSVMAALIQKYGKDINGVLADSALQGSGAIEAYLAAGYKAGEIPPVTGGDVAHMYQLSSKYNVPMAGIDYPPSMGARSIAISLDVLAGRPVPRRVEVSTTVVVSKGDDTASVKGDETPEQHVRADAPGDLAPSNGLPADYDPRTFKVDYPH